MKRLICIILVGVMAFTSAMAKDKYPFQNPSQAIRFQGLLKQFRCLVCQNEDLYSSNAPLASDLSKQIYQKVRAGQTDQQIIDYMVNRYGTFVLFKPPVNRLTIGLWVLPFVWLLLGFYLIYCFFKRHKSP